MITIKNTVIVDIDGTVSEIGNRLKYIQKQPKDWDSFYKYVDEDKPIKEIIKLVRRLHFSGYKIIYCTGRRESCREKTIKWLSAYFLPSLCYSPILLMRKENDHRADIEVKPELLKSACIDFDEIAFILEDRTSMVKKWRELGMICLQVSEGNF